MISGPKSYRNFLETDPRIPDSKSKIFLDSVIRITLHVDSEQSLVFLCKVTARET